MSSSSVLYDAPGPRAKRRAIIGSIVSIGLILLGAYYLIYRPLKDAGQLERELWDPLLNPNHELFPKVWNRIGEGIQATLLAAGLAILLSLICGMVLAVVRIQLKALMRHRFTHAATPLRYSLRILSWTLNSVTRFCVEIFRGLPVIITIFFVSRLGPELGLAFEDPMWAVVIGLTLYNMVVIAEIIRSGIENLPTGQREAAEALGLSSLQTTRMILLPQAVRIMLPALISQIVVILKDTSLGALIAYTELLNIGKQIAGFLRNPLQVYAVIAVLYIGINFVISQLARYVQYRIARSGTVSTPSNSQLSAPKP